MGNLMGNSALET